MLIGLGGLAALAGGGYAIYGEMPWAERDRHAVIQEVEELQRRIRRHDGQLFMRLGMAPNAAHVDALLDALGGEGHIHPRSLIHLELHVELFGPKALGFPAKVVSAGTQSRDLERTVGLGDQPAPKA